MIKIYTLSQRTIWDEIVKTFPNYDIYYLSGYVRAFYVNGDGEPELLYYEEGDLRAIYVYMKRQTAIAGLFDTVTPYGYGGVLFDKIPTKNALDVFWKAFTNHMRSEHVVDDFVRFHPLLENAIPMKQVANVIDLGHTIAIELTSPEVIWENITSKNRNMIRKAEKNGIIIHHAHDWTLFQDFQRIYDATMEKDHAEEYYFFKQPFYQSIHQDLDGHYELFYATIDGQIIAMSIILFANKYMHYHLSGSIAEYRNLAPSNLLLYKAALWGCEQGYQLFHLGGGVGSGEDNLYKFKAAFNRNNQWQFSIGRNIFMDSEYDELVAERAQRDVSLNSNSSYFPLYRS